MELNPPRVIFDIAVERLELELESREKAEAAAAEAERQRSVLAVDLKDIKQKLDRLEQEYNVLLDKVKNCKKFSYSSLEK